MWNTFLSSTHSFYHGPFDLTVEAEILGMCPNVVNHLCSKIQLEEALIQVVKLRLELVHHPISFVAIKGRPPMRFADSLRISSASEAPISASPFWASSQTIPV